jgi:hypothetical protein
MREPARDAIGWYFDTVTRQPDLAGVDEPESTAAAGR